MTQKVVLDHPLEGDGVFWLRHRSADSLLTWACPWGTETWETRASTLGSQGSGWGLGGGPPRFPGIWKRVSLPARARGAGSFQEMIAADGKSCAA